MVRPGRRKGDKMPEKSYAEKMIDVVNTPGVRQIDVIKPYRICIFAVGNEIDWSAINQAIISKWSDSGLLRIKEAAWKWSFE
jgi:hypothetical protein